MWHVAHVLISSRRKNCQEANIFVEESFVLVEADDYDEAYEKVCRDIQAEVDARNQSEHAFEDGSVGYFQFEGIRKIMTIWNAVNGGNDRPPVSGSELSYSNYIVAKDDINKLVDGEAVTLTYVE